MYLEWPQMQTDNLQHKEPQGTEDSDDDYNDYVSIFVQLFCCRGRLEKKY